MSRLITVRLNHSMMGRLELDVEFYPRDGGTTVLSGEIISVSGIARAGLTEAECKKLCEDDEVGEAAGQYYAEMMIDEAEDPDLDRP